jgi:hypothetical protein
LENLTPTQAALLQHVKWALLRASFYWDKATSVQQGIPDLSEWGWVKVAPEHGNLYGPHSQMLQWHAPFYCTALASRHAREGANANELVSDAQPRANVKAGARITRAVMTSNTCCEHDRLKSRACTYMTLMLNKPGFIN